MMSSSGSAVAGNIWHTATHAEHARPMMQARGGGSSCCWVQWATGGARGSGRGTRWVYCPLQNLAAYSGLVDYLALR